MKITLTPAQAAQLAPLLQDAYRRGGTVFAQAMRESWPDNSAVVIQCHCLPGDTSRRLRVFLNKEAQRLAQKIEGCETQADGVIHQTL